MYTRDACFVFSLPRGHACRVPRSLPHLERSDPVDDRGDLVDRIDDHRLRVPGKVSLYPGQSFVSFWPHFPVNKKRENI